MRLYGTQCKHIHLYRWVNDAVGGDSVSHGVGRMTDEQIIEALATKVMGWVLTNYETGDSIPEDWADAQSNDGWFWEGREGSHEAHEWNPLRNPADSKLLREKLAERFKTSALCRNVDQSMTFSVSKHGAATSYYAEADTEERAVALCALKAVGAEV